MRMMILDNDLNLISPEYDPTIGTSRKELVHRGGTLESLILLVSIFSVLNFVPRMGGVLRFSLSPKPDRRFVFCSASKKGSFLLVFSILGIEMMSHLSEPSAPPNKLARTSCMLQHDNVMQMHHDLP